MDIYKKDNILQQIREQINLNKQNIELKGGNLNKYQNKDIQDILKVFQNNQNEDLQIKNKLIDNISKIVNDLDDEIQELNFENKIKEIKHEKDILKKMLEKIRSNKFL